MNNLTILTLAFFLFFHKTSISQNNTKEAFGILFYNVENLFDTLNDSLKQDEEFLPKGEKKWNRSKYNNKLNRISRVIYESGGWKPPCLIGLCEIENEKTLKDLIYATGLSNLGYRYIHYESNDLRGIDVSLLYCKNNFTPLESKPINIDLGANNRPTRDILYTFGLYKETIPLHIFVCHFPSRYGGMMESAPKRLIAAQTLCDTIQLIQKADMLANIIVMGDFNDNPTNKSIQLLTSRCSLKNLSTDHNSINHSPGTLKHQFEWNTFDQFFVSDILIDSTNTLTAPKKMKILDFGYLLEEDKSYTGKKPFRTYIGYRYNNGFSDHLPVWISIRVNQKL